MNADLKNPKTVETILATNPFTESVRLELVRGYYAFCQSSGLAWKKPKCHYTRPQPYVPTEHDIDLLIAGCGKRTATLLQFLKDTGARVSEAVLTQEKDIDYDRREITIAKPSKGSNSRTVRVSEKCLAMLKNMPKKYAPYIFSPNVSSLHCSFNISREKLARKLNNDNLRKIHFHSFRHFKGWTTTVQFGKEYAQYVLGHKNPQNTEWYAHYKPNPDSGEWIVRRPRTKEEEDDLVAHNYDYVRFDETERCPIYKKRKF